MKIEPIYPSNQSRPPRDKNGDTLHVQQCRRVLNLIRNSNFPETDRKFLIGLIQKEMTNDGR